QALVEDHHAMPFGLLAPLARGLVAPAIRSGYPQIRDRTAVLGAANFRVRTEIANEDHLVDATCHDTFRVTTCDDFSGYPKTTRRRNEDYAENINERQTVIKLNKVSKLGGARSTI